MDTQMKKGILEMCILFTLKDASLYGYEVMKQIQELFPDVYSGSIYTILRRLNRDGYTTIEKRESLTGPPRKYYEITVDGKMYLELMLSEWISINKSVESLGITLR